MSDTKLEARKAGAAKPAQVLADEFKHLNKLAKESTK